MTKLLINNKILEDYKDLFNHDVLDALEKLSSLNQEQKNLMQKRYDRRLQRIKNQQDIIFLDENDTIEGTNLKVKDAREGNFEGSPIPKELQRQWIQGTGPGAKPNLTPKKSIRNVAYALLSGADGWMFDGEDALGQIKTMSLDNQRNLKIAIAKEPLFMEAAEQVSIEMNKWSIPFLGRKVIEDYQKQLDFTTIIYRVRGLHLDDRHIKENNGDSFSASITDMCIYVVNNYKKLQQRGQSVILYLPKIQTAEEAAFFNKIISKLENHLGLEEGSIKIYVLIEQVEACFQLMEIRAVLGKHFVGFNTGRWDYINSVSDAVSWKNDFINPNIDSITMTYKYMKTYEDRVRRAVNTPDKNGNYALWQGGMEPNIPVGGKEGVAKSMKKAKAGAKREQMEGASGKWVAHWKMVHIVRPAWEIKGQANQMGKSFPRLTYTEQDALDLFGLEQAPLTVLGARDLLSVALQYGNAFFQGFQAAALKPADFFDDENILYLMEDAATGEIRLSILWEWLHKGAKFTEEDTKTNIKKGDIFTRECFVTLVEEEYKKLLEASDKDVHEDSKATTLPIAKEIVLQYVLNVVKLPWYIDLLNINLNNQDVDIAKNRIQQYINSFSQNNIRVSKNLDL